MVCVAEQIEGLFYVIRGVLHAHLDHHDIKKLLEIYSLSVVFDVSARQVLNQFCNVFLCWIKAESSEYNLQVGGFNGARSGCIKVVEGLFDLILLTVCENILIVDFARAATLTLFCFHSRNSI